MELKCNNFWNNKIISAIHGCKRTSLETEEEQISMYNISLQVPEKLCDNLIGFLIQLFPLHMGASHASTSGFSVY